MYKVELSDITDRTVGRHRTISTVSQTWSSATNHEYARSYQYEFFTIDTAIESLLPRNNLHTSWSESTQRRNSKQPAPVVKKNKEIFSYKNADPYGTRCHGQSRYVDFRALQRTPSDTSHALPVYRSQWRSMHLRKSSTYYQRPDQLPWLPTLRK